MRSREAILAVLLILLRLIIALAVLVLPFIGWALLDGSPEAMIVMIFPVILTIPALLLGLFVFTPVEWMLNRRGLRHRKNTLVPLAGAIAVPATMNAITMLSFAAGGFADLQLLMRGRAILLSSILLAVLGAIWGCYWRLTEWAARRILRRPEPLPGAAR